MSETVYSENSTEYSAGHDNERLERILRCRLVVSGRGIIVFGLWSVIESISWLLYDPMDVKGTIRAIHCERWFIPVVYTILFVTMVLFDLLPRIFAGRAAIREGKAVLTEDRRKKKGVIILSAYMALINIVFVIVAFIPGSQHVDFLDMFVSLFIDAATVFVSMEILTSVIRLRRLIRIRKKKAV